MWLSLLQRSDKEHCFPWKSLPLEVCLGQYTAVPPKIKGTFKCYSFHIPLHMTVYKTNSDNELSFFCKANCTAGLQMQRPPHQCLALQRQLHWQIPCTSLGISQPHPNIQCRHDFRAAEQKQLFQHAGKAL